MGVMPLDPLPENFDVTTLTANPALLPIPLRYKDEVGDLRRIPGEWRIVVQLPTSQDAGRFRGKLERAYTDLEWRSRSINGKPSVIAMYPGADQPTARQTIDLVVADETAWPAIERALTGATIDLRLADNTHLTRRLVTSVTDGAINTTDAAEPNGSTPPPTHDITRIYLHDPGGTP